MFSPKYLAKTKDFFRGMLKFGRDTKIIFVQARRILANQQFHQNNQNIFVIVMK